MRSTGLIKSKGLRLGVLVLCSASVIVFGLLMLRAGTNVIRAEGPVFSIASAWPPIPTRLSGGGGAFSKAVFSGASDDGLLVAWTEGENNPNGALWCRWNNGSGWQEKVRVDNTSGYNMFSADAALVGTNAYFVWGTQTAVDQYQVYYRSWNLATTTLSATELVRQSSKELGDVQIVFAGGKPHVVWVEKTEVDGIDVDRIYYAGRNGFENWPSEKISGGCFGGTCADRNIFEESMPAVHAEGNEVYVAWREQSSTVGKSGIYFRHLDSGTGWQPPDNTTDPLGQQLSDDGGDALPTLDAPPISGRDNDRVYVAWERYGGQQCGTGANASRCFEVYTLTYRVWLDTSDVVTHWWPLIDQDARAVIRDDMSVVTATSTVPTTAENPDEYLSGARPDIQVVYASGVYTPYITWQTWVLDPSEASDPPPTVDTDHPLKAGLLFAYDGGIGTYGRWDPIQATNPLWQEHVFYAGADRVFGGPLLALTEGAQGGYDPHIVMNAQGGQGWSVLYTNPYQYYWVYLPAAFRNYP